MKIDPRQAGLVCALAWLPCWAWASQETLASMPVATSNNAVAMLESRDGVQIVSFQGLLEGKQWSDIHKRVWAYGGGQWRELDPVPVSPGRLAGAAVGIGSHAWLFGGYTVAEDGSEVSTPEVFYLAPGSVRLKQVSEMPVPVDDMTAFAYRDRYIYLVSGWHDVGNVNLVQVFDTHTLEWAQATPYPGAPVFGHAGGLSGNTMLICGGVRIEYPEDASSRRFLPARECWLGEINAEDHRRITWRPVAHHPGPARYRAAAVAGDSSQIVFAGGSDNPYNYDGVGYDGQPSEPLSAVLRFDIETGQWDQPLELTVPSMDHRALLYGDGWYYLVGGMLQSQQVSNRLIRFRLK